MPRPLRNHHQPHPPDNLDRWLISYADFITLLFAFFVVMYAISSVNEGKYKVFGASLTEAFGSHGPNKTDSMSPPNENSLLLKSLAERRTAKLTEKVRNQQVAMQSVAKNLNQAMAPLVTSGQVSISQSSRGVVLEINASTLFQQGEAEVQSAAIITLSEVATILQPGDQSIEVEGHTDDLPIKTPRFPSNWELSSARASSVARMFIDHGITASRLTIVGSASNHPVAPNDTPEGRARNRRMTVTLMAPGMERSAQLSAQP
jgi:chemotaxis protein MotB